MQYNVLDALAMITREKNVDRKIVIESLVAGLQSAARKKLGAEAVIDARIDEVTGEMTVEHVKVVVDNVMDEDAELTVEEAQEEFASEQSDMMAKNDASNILSLIPSRKPTP